jgi:hypothetical protein
VEAIQVRTITAIQPVARRQTPPSIPDSIGSSSATPKEQPANSTSEKQGLRAVTFSMPSMPSMFRRTVQSKVRDPTPTTLAAVPPERAAGAALEVKRQVVPKSIPTVQSITMQSSNVRREAVTNNQFAAWPSIFQNCQKTMRSYSSNRPEEYAFFSFMDCAKPHKKARLLVQKAQTMVQLFRVIFDLQDLSDDFQEAVKGCYRHGPRGQKNHTQSNHTGSAATHACAHCKPTAVVCTLYLASTSVKLMARLDGR